MNPDVTATALLSPCGTMPKVTDADLARVAAGTADTEVHARVAEHNRGCDQCSRKLLELIRAVVA